MSVSEIERRWQSSKPDDRAVAIEAINALHDRSLAIDLVREMLSERPPRWNDPAWEELDGLAPELKAGAVAEMLFAGERQRSEAIRTLAGREHWQPAEQMLNELLATTDANFEDHGKLIANGIQEVGEGKRARDVLRELKLAIAASD